MQVDIMTKEWPPDIYGGAGVHVEHLVEQLSRLAHVRVHCFGAPRTDALAQPVPGYLDSANPALQTLGVDLGMVAAVTDDVSVVHSHTWYANLAGHLTGLLHGVPHVLTAHSLEPHRPWKREQLAGGFDVSSWVERTSYRGAAAVIAVSDGMRRDILTSYPEVEPERVHVVHNGIDTDVYRPDPSQEVLAKYGIDPARPYALFVGRITRQKGLVHLLRAARAFDDEVALVLCASSPDTPEIAQEISASVDTLKSERGSDAIVWIDEQVERSNLIGLLTHALVFTCPSVYEPLGIVNLEAMACETAVVASAVGGIPEVVEDGRTGLLVPYDPTDPTGFESDFADAVNSLARDPGRAANMGRSGRLRAVEHFGWDAIAQRTMDVYRWAIDHRVAAVSDE